MVQNKEQKLLKLTELHYNKYTFDFASEKRIAYVWDSHIFREFLKNIKPGDVFVDVGCGTGEILKSIQNSIKCFLLGLDLSSVSIKLAYAKKLNNLLVADNMNLPIKKNTCSRVLSYGVIHHTPNAHRSFEELVRITKKNGKILLSVYNKKHFYFLIYKTVGAVGRFLRRTKYLDGLNRYLFFPLFYCMVILPENILIMKHEPWISYTISWNIYNDQLLTPQASFHTKKEIENWSAKQGCEILAFSKETMGQRISVIIQKT